MCLHEDTPHGLLCFIITHVGSRNSLRQLIAISCDQENQKIVVYIQDYEIIHNNFSK